LRKIESLSDVQFDINLGLIGGAAWDVYKSHFPEETKTLCDNSDAVLF